MSVHVNRLLAGFDPAGPLDLRAHLHAYGPLAVPPDVLRRVERSGLRGRGGGSFPAGRKWRAVAGAGRRPVVVVNGCESEPASVKDAVLLRHLPHLVLDGAAVAAEALGARDVRICVGEDASVDALAAAIAERPERRLFRIERVPRRYTASEESALVQYLNGGPALPAFVPPRPFERGVGGAPTLIQNAESMAHVALITRHGSRWFREVGTPDDPGTTLVTISGAVRDAGVYEIALGARLRDVLALARPVGRPQAVLLGGYFGAWVNADRALPLAHHGLREHGVSLGCGVIVALPEGACGICETAAALSYLEAESAGQCGPCVHGLRAISERLAALRPGSGELLRRWGDEIEGRGACHHPDGAVRLLRSALEVFAADFARHERGGACPGGSRRGAFIGVPAAVAA